MLTACELAQELKVSVAAIRYWTRRGIPCQRVGRLIRFDLETVKAWLHQRGQVSLEKFRMAREKLPVPQFPVDVSPRPEGVTGAPQHEMTA